MQPGTVIDRKTGQRHAPPAHKGRQETVQSFKLGQSKEIHAPECLQRRPGIRAAIIKQATTQAIGKT